MLAERVGTPQSKLFSLEDFNRPQLDLDMPIVLYGTTATRHTASQRTQRRTSSTRWSCAAQMT